MYNTSVVSDVEGSIPPHENISFQNCTQQEAKMVNHNSSLFGNIGQITEEELDHYSKYISSREFEIDLGANTLFKNIEGNTTQNTNFKI